VSRSPERSRRIASPRKAQEHSAERSAAGEPKPAEDLSEVEGERVCPIGAQRRLEVRINTRRS